MDNENDKVMPLVQVTETDIVMSEKGPSFQPEKTVLPVILKDSKDERIDKESGQDRRATLEPLADGSQSSQNELKSMADKAAVCMMRRVQIAIDAEDWPTLDRLMPTLMKLLDAQMAMEWSIKWQRHILEKPQQLTSLKAGSMLTELNKGRAMKARKADKGDQRTTPKRLLKDLPQDDVA